MELEGRGATRRRGRRWAAGSALFGISCCGSNPFRSARGGALDEAAVEW